MICHSCVWEVEAVEVVLLVLATLLVLAAAVEAEVVW